MLDLGSNSTRLLIAEVTPDGGVTELVRRSTVTRLGHRVDATGRLDEAAMQRVMDVLDDYRAMMDAHDVQAATGVLTAAAREASNGSAFAARVAERYDVEVSVIDGDREAALTFTGATSARPADGRRTVVIDVGGGSTEFVVGVDRQADFPASTRAGVVRQTERHLHDDPPTREQLAALRAEAAETFAAAVPADIRTGVEAGIAVAGTATSCAAMAQGLGRYDGALVHGYRLARATVEDLLERLGTMPESERRHVPGLDPDRAGVIVAGLCLQLEAMLAFDLDEIEVSEHDLLRGAALELARSLRPAA